MFSISDEILKNPWLSISGCLSNLIVPHRCILAGYEVRIDRGIICVLYIALYLICLLLNLVPECIASISGNEK